MFSCRAAWQRCGPLVRKAASSRLPRDVVQRRQMSSAPGGSGENIVYTILCGAAFAGGLAYLYSTLAGDKARYDDRLEMIQSRPTTGWDSRPWPPKSEDEEEAVAEEEEVAEVATEVEAPAEEETVVEAVATAVATEAAEVVVEAAEVVVEAAEVVVEAAEVVVVFVEAPEVVVEAAEVVVEAAQEVEAVAKEVAQVAEAVEEAAQALAEPAAVEEPAAENNGTAVAPHVEEADSS